MNWRLIILVAMQAALLGAEGPSYPRIANFYQKWEQVPNQPHLTAFVDGGGAIANPWQWNKLPWKEKSVLIAEARRNEQRMRFNLCFTLMGGGYAAFDYHTTARGQHWWFPEWNAKLGHPREAMQKRPGYWFREFDKGTVFVNPFKQPATIREAGGLVLAPFDGKIRPSGISDARGNP